MNTCRECGETTDNPRFCGKSCSAKYNNTRRTKKEKPSCELCGITIDKRSKRCRRCSSIKKDIVTLEQAIYDNHHRSSAFALIRSRARVSIRNAGRGGECEWCGYDKHTEVAHRTPVSSFAGETLIETINSQDNLLCLCPNCHYEHDKLGRRT